MTTIRRMICSLALTLLAVLPTWACGEDWDDPTMYNLFRCTIPLENLKTANLGESQQFWANYAGLECNDELLSAMTSMWLSEFDDEESSNLLIATLRQGGKTEALSLLRLNAELESAQQTDWWDYKKPDPSTLNELYNRISALKVSGPLTRRKTFLRMRCLMAMEDYDACLRLWESFGQKWEECLLRQRMEGYVAGIYLRRGEYDKALPTFFRQHDGGSIRMCFNRLLKESSIEKEYDKDPNAPILGYYLEDYANYLYHALHNDYWNAYEDENPIWTRVTRQQQQMLALAQRVLKEGKSRDPQMWQAFEGFMRFAAGDADGAYAAYCKAEKLQGNSPVRPLLRHYKLAALLKSEKQPAGFDQYLVEELNYYYQNDEKEPLERDVLHLLYSGEVASGLTAYVGKRKDPVLDYLTNSALHPYAYWNMDHGLTIEHAQGVLSLIDRQGGDDALTRTLLQHSGLTREYVAETIGTKLMRADRYDEAATYFGQLNDEYLSQLGIYPYLAMRKMPKHDFTREDYSDISRYDLPDQSSTHNYKLEFCSNVLDLKRQVQEGTGEDKARAAYQLGSLLYQASAAGDLWAMSEYGWSAADEHCNELNAQSIHYLNEALLATTDYATKVRCYFGLAANPTERGGAYVDYNDEKEDYQVNATGTQLEAYRWLKEQQWRTEDVFKTCDWLKLYVAQRD